MFNLMEDTSYNLAVIYGYEGNPKEWLCANNVNDIDCSINENPYIIYKILNIIHIVFCKEKLYDSFFKNLKNKIHYINNDNNIINIKNKKYLNNIEEYCIISLREVINDNLDNIVDYIKSNKYYSQYFDNSNMNEDINKSLYLIINNDYCILSLMSILKLGKNKISINI